jgi:signal peptidase I
MLALSALILFGTRSVVQAREVLGPSMQPTFQQGQRLLLWPHQLGEPGHRDIVVFWPPFPSHDELIKRVIGVPGDHVSISGGRVTVNGHTLDEPYINGAVTTCAGQYCDVTLGAGGYYVLGDNRPDSSDSRFWGPIQADQISGKALLRFFPLGDLRAWW